MISEAVQVMEIEAKMSVPDPGVYWTLQTADSVGDYTLVTVQVKNTHDIYLDTRWRRILAAGYSCLLRESSEGIVVTLKSITTAEGAVHRRGEWEISLRTFQQPAEWPESDVRQLVLPLVGRDPLIPLFDMQQTRIIRMLSQAEKPVAEIRLDRVSMISNKREQAYLDLEVELFPGVPEANLRAIIKLLQEAWNLQPEPLSKFERGLELLDQAQ